MTNKHLVKRYKKIFPYMPSEQLVTSILDKERQIIALLPPDQALLKESV